MICWKYLPEGSEERVVMLEGWLSTAKGEDNIWSKIWKEKHKTFFSIKKNVISFFYQLNISTLFLFLPYALNFCHLLDIKRFPLLICLIIPSAAKAVLIAHPQEVIFRTTGIIFLRPSRVGFGVINYPPIELSKNNKVEYQVNAVSVQKSLWKIMKTKFFLLIRWEKLTWFGIQSNHYEEVQICLIK